MPPSRLAMPAPGPTAPVDAPAITTVRGLGGRGALYLLALIRAQPMRQPVGPTPAACSIVLSTLDALGVIRRGRDTVWMGQPTRGGDLPWVYAWPYVPFAQLESELHEFLLTQGRTALFADAWFRIWEELLPEEITGYFLHQLRLHRFPDEFADALAPLLPPRLSSFSLGQWRYACWATVRRMASVSLQQPGNNDLLRTTASAELQRRLVLTQQAASTLCFSPSLSLPDCTLAEALYSVATPLGENYWRCPPLRALLD